MLYAHVPFCERLCTYCSFNRFLYKEDRAREYFGHLRDEMRLVADLGYDFASLYVGGGTPTILLDELAETIDLAKRALPRHPRGLGRDEPQPPRPTNSSRCSTGRVQRLSCGVQSFDDRLLRQMDRYGKYGTGEEVFERLAAMAGQVPLVQRRHDLQLPEPDRGESCCATSSCVKATGANQTTFYPLMASPLRRRELAETVGDIDFEREARYYRLVADALAPEFEPASAWTFSRDSDAMIDEYIVDFPEYVGVGSGALSFLDGTIYGNTFSLGEYGDADRRTARWRSSSAASRYGFWRQMRYRFVTDMFGLRLDKKRFREDFGVPVELGLFGEIAFLTLVGGIATNNAEEITLTRQGPLPAARHDARDARRQSTTPATRRAPNCRSKSASCCSKATRRRSSAVEPALAAG